MGRERSKSTTHSPRRFPGRRMSAHELRLCTSGEVLTKFSHPKKRQARDGTPSALSLFWRNPACSMKPAPPPASTLPGLTVMYRMVPQWTCSRASRRRSSVLHRVSTIAYWRVEYSLPPTSSTWTLTSSVATFRAASSISAIFCFDLHGGTIGPRPSEATGKEFTFAPHRLLPEVACTACAAIMRPGPRCGIGGSEACLNPAFGIIAACSHAPRSELCC